MRNLILLAMSAGMAWAQQAPANPENIQDALRKLDELADRQRRASLEAQIAGLKAQEAALQATLDRLRQRYSDAYPDVKTAREQLEVLRLQMVAAERQRAREEYLATLKEFPAQPPPDAPKIALPDRWWKNSVTSQYLGLTADQQRKMDDVLQQFRLKLTTENMDLHQQELVMEPLVSGEPLNESKITAQLDRVAEARAELEKTNGRMLLGIRKLLTPDQWVKLNQAFTLSLTQK